MTDSRAEPKYLAYRFDVLGNEWTVYYCSKKYFCKKFPEDKVGTYALTVCDDRKIYLRTDKMSRETIRHELGHAYIWDMGAACAALEPHQLEEIYCELVAKYGKRIHKQGDQIAEAYNILKLRTAE